MTRRIAASIAAALVMAGCANACTRKESPANARGPVIAAAVPGAPEGTAKAPGAKEAPSPAPTARFVGRFDTRDPEGARFAWSGSTILARFEGTSLSVRLLDEGYNRFQIVVDGKPAGILKTKKDKDATYAVVTDLPAGVHEVELHKRTEARVGEVVFRGFETDGEMLPAPKPRARHIELIGDSITTGYGNEGPGPKCGFNPTQQNEYLTYGAIAARALSADHTTIAWSGKTLHEMRELFPRTLPEREDSAWDFSRYEPQLVVVNVGTNNFALRDPGQARFTKLYTELIERVRAAYPRAFIACCLGPMLTDVYPEGHHNLTQARKYMRAVVAALKEHDDKLDLLEFPEQKYQNGLGCGFHPSLKTHELMAKRLVSFTRERLGW